MSHSNVPFWVTAATCCVVATPASAVNFNYTHAEFLLTANPSGMGATGRYTLFEGAHAVIGGSSQFEGDWNLHGGVGFHAPLNEFIDMYGELQAHNIKDPDDERRDTGDFATGVGIGIRAWVAPQFEANAYVGSIIFDSDNSESVVELGGRFHSTEALSLGATWRANGLEEDRMIFSVRYVY